MKRKVGLPTLAGAALAAAAVGFAAACFQVPLFPGPYACGDEGACTGEGFVCSDGVCCQPEGTPFCPIYVFPDGHCADGGVAQTYYEDMDGDGYGNENNPKKYCGTPRYDKVSTRTGDCNDNPSAGGELVFPGAVEQCDGRDNNCDPQFQIDEGFPQKPFYRDQDSDGYGDKAQVVMACAAPVGYVDNALDCQPTRPEAHPGATEICNKIDDDCDGPVDEDVPGANMPCTHPTAKGLCQAGKTACVNGAMTCSQVVMPTPDYCDSEDNDCDGSTDDKPDCGGPSTVIPDAGNLIGAVDLNASKNGDPGDCVRNLTGTSPETVTRTTVNSQPVIRWTGAGGSTHSFFFTPPANRFWDLTKAGTKLSIGVDYALNSSLASGFWSAHNQPLVMICGPSGYLRLVKNARILGPTETGRLDLLIPVDGTQLATYGWTALAYPAGTKVSEVLKKVYRVDILIQPTNAATASFTLTFNQLGFQ